ncbi:MAG: pyridoxal phosphate-dependent aminotransferase [Candidatus Omnitrophica bacterium]|nr:pyridoxal phosphate-dependent aminotransferase [Candidatus Omnitrophota bacterium]
MLSERTRWDLCQNRLSEALSLRKERGERVLDLTCSNPTQCDLLLYPPEILRAFDDPRCYQYNPSPQGLLAAREAVCAYYSGQCVNIHPDQVFFTAGTSDAYSYLFQLLADPGDSMVALRPGYPLFDTLAGLQGLELRGVSLEYWEGWALPAHALEAAFQKNTKALLCVHPNNPTGNYLKHAERIWLLELAARHQAALIADEVFYDFSWKENPEQAPSFAGNEEALCFTLNGISKMLALPQMKLSWIALSGPKALRQEAAARLEVVCDAHLSVGTPAQVALESWLHLRPLIQEKICRRLSLNRQTLLKQCRISGSVEFLDSEGGWYAVIRVPQTRTDEAWALYLLEEYGVHVHPGYLFDFSEEGYLVLSLLPTPEVFEEALALCLKAVEDAA